LYNILEEPKNSKEISAQLSVNERYLDRLMNALCSLDLLQKQNGKFRNTKFSSKYLVEGKPDFMSNLFHTADLWKSWSYLTDVIHQGKPARALNDKFPQNKVENFIAAMDYRAIRQADEDVKLLNTVDVKNLLDLGGGSGAYAIAFVKTNSIINATVFDLPDVIPLTENYISEAGLSDKIKTLKGNYLTDDIGKDYDLIFLSAIVHSNSYNENLKLIKKCADALNKNGRIVIQDFIMNEERTEPEFGTFFALNMLVNTRAGDTYTGKEISTWLTKAGLSDIKRNETTHGATQIIGTKK
jgi:cyclopropane fatty-acyl-phospholipid synthase-like methyltransferase